MTRRVTEIELCTSPEGTWRRTRSDSLKKYADAVMASKPVAFWRLHDESVPSAKDTTGSFPATYEKGSAPLPTEPGRPNFTGGRVKAKVPRLGNAYSVEMWVRNKLRERFAWDDITLDHEWAGLIEEVARRYVEGEQ